MKKKEKFVTRSTWVTHAEVMQVNVETEEIETQCYDIYGKCSDETAILRRVKDVCGAIVKPIKLKHMESECVVLGIPESKFYELAQKLDVAPRTKNEMENE